MAWVIALAKEEHYNSTMPQSDLCHLLHNLTDLKYECSSLALASLANEWVFSLFKELFHPIIQNCCKLISCRFKLSCLILRAFEVRIWHVSSSSLKKAGLNIIFARMDNISQIIQNRFSCIFGLIQFTKANVNVAEIKIGTKEITIYIGWSL